MRDLSALLGGARCWWSDIPADWCGHCKGLVDTSGAWIE